MTHGKKVCKILKEIRQEIADKNEIEYITSECHYHGACKGTCPKCEAELKYLENELQKRKQLGKVATIAGISLGIAGAFTTCNTQPKQDLPSDEKAVNVDSSYFEMSGVIINSNWVDNMNGYSEGSNDNGYEVGEYQENDIHKFTDKMPDFPGGYDAIKKIL